ncbi:hypothetical protein LHP98_10300 [Rhodobacter sp. Har01]|uniref:hypothetical protein n=1 Tax=Rhodobacter sp. Har01 TaxID=2883999 RepID=UPI001D07BDFC|nr:hypothetical protein [Rhodobacter sp. Har01]MCB6178522.1 hypothetical protein [Rhodobacter sp. Har01]
MKAALAALLLLATPAAAEIAVSQSIGQNGIAATLATLDAVDQPTPAERFALGGLRFLSGIESALQLQWRTGMDQALGQAGDTTGLPLLRLPLPPNPSPEPFQGALLSQLFADVDAKMQAARQDLAALPQGQDFALEVAFADLWFDVNANGARDAGEDAGAILGPQLMGWQWAERDPALPLPVIRFDTADAAWLAAYAHLLSGISNVVLAYDPAEAIDRVIAARMSLKVAPPSTGPDYSFDASFGQFMDTFAMVEGAVNKAPDVARAQAAKAQFLGMVEQNRRFWTLAVQETDNDREWIPAEGQTSALGFDLPPGTGPQWLAVLADGEALLTGRLLLPYWRGPGGQGVNFGRMFDDPRPISVTGWLQGWAAVPYMEQGPVVSDENLRRFDEMMLGNAGLMMVFLN